MAQGRDITKAQFHKVMRNVKSGELTAAEIAKLNGISIESVRAIKRAKTWPNFEAAKQARRVKRSSKAINIRVKPSRSPEDNLQLQLEKIEDKPLTPEYAEELLESMREVRLGNQHVATKLDTLTHHVEKLVKLASKQRKRWWGQR
ncbi:hypothetical protein [Glutamicibacter halophytocola]|uniref:hypothetical protein n=1 Tax=Glutamicibacter halophytocola TaxID=1933880 RepID=UPI0015C523DE|nr:hypothetical protein [Glutamicibacter halophytocola]NQD41433.1 hypothetical protein [Glutamicibacter halophytocola]